MKKLILFSLVAISNFFAFAQNNPYEVFGYESKINYNDSRENIFDVKNTDGTNAIKTLAFDFDKRVVYLLDINHTTIKAIAINDERLLKWLSVDPKAQKYAGLSPYNFVGNNPINNIDPDGSEIKPLTTTDVKILQSAFDQYSSVFSYTTYRDPQNVGDASGPAASKNVFTSMTAPSVFESRLKNSKLTDAQKADARAVFQVLTSKDVVEIGVVTPASNVTTQSLTSDYKPTTATEFKGTTNADALTLFNDPNKTDAGIQSTLLGQPISGTTQNNGAYGFFPQPQNGRTQNGNGGQFVGALLVNPGTVPASNNTYMDSDGQTTPADPVPAVTKAITNIATQNIVTPK